MSRKRKRVVLRHRSIYRRRILLPLILQLLLLWLWLMLHLLHGLELLLRQRVLWHLRLLPLNASVV